MYSRQKEISRIFKDNPDGLWTRDKILLKLTEELGEVVQAFRKKSTSDQIEEIGDLLLGIFCLAKREGINLDESWAIAVQKLNQSLQS